MAQQQGSRSRAGTAGGGATGATGAGEQGRARELAHEASEKANEVAQRAGDKAGELAHEASEKASEVAQRAGDKAGELAHKAGQAAESGIEHRKHDVANGIHVVADALRLGAERIRERGNGESTTYVTRIADRVDEVSGYLESRQVGELAREVEGFARRHAGAFLGGAFALGVIGARFAKSSGERGMGTAPRPQTLERRPPSHEEFGTAHPTRSGGVYG